GGPRARRFRSPTSPRRGEPAGPGREARAGGHARGRGLTASRPRCSLEARRRKDQVAATASHVRNWLLLEQPGAWGPDAVMQSRLPRRVARALHELGHELGIRVILIRRHNRRPNGLNVFLAHTGGSRTPPRLLHG